MILSILEIDDGELQELKDLLGAKLDIYRGKDTSGGDIDTLELTRDDTCDDLADSEDFDQLAEGYDATSVDFLFEYENFGEVRVRVSKMNGSVWFRTAIPEQVIDHVYEALREVKGL